MSRSRSSTGQGRVALDAMGGDHAPAVTVAGAVRAARDFGVHVALVGRRAEIERHLDGAVPGGIEIVDAADVVEMDEDPVVALRAKPGASVRVACELVASGGAAAVVSAGSTGATLAAGLLTLGRIPGVRRPVVAAVIPLPGGRRVVLLDAGGTTDVHPEVFAGYAVMGCAYAEALGMAHPSVGLLNIGAEPGKGNALAKDAFEVLGATPRFAGNVEPPAVLAGAVDVVVTDGFTGNVFLKTIESVAPVEDHDACALVLGVRGEVFVAHGGAGAGDVAKALQRATQIAGTGLATTVAQRLAEESSDGAVARQEAG